jgi:hypothetical protein
MRSWSFRPLYSHTRVCHYLDQLHGGRVAGEDVKGAAINDDGQTLVDGVPAAHMQA